MKAVRKVRGRPTFDIPSVAANSPHARARTKWMSDNAATLAAQTLEHHPHPEKITQDEVLALVKIIPVDADPRGGYARSHVKVGDETVHCTTREIRIAAETLNYSPRVGGLHRQKEMPAEAGIAEKSLRMVRKALKSLKYKGPDIQGAIDEGHRKYGFARILFTLERPEGGGTYLENGGFEHLPDDEMEKEALKVATEIHLRWRNRHDIYGRVMGAESWAKEVVANVDGVDFLRVAPPTRIHYSKDGTVERIGVMCVFSVLGDTLQRVERNAMAHGEDGIRHLIGQHVRNSRKLAKAPNGADAADGRTVEPILAAAVRAGMHLYGKGMLKEIEAVLRGTHVHADNPIRRGISIFNMKNGELVGPVTLGKGVRFQKGRVHAKAIKTLPQTMMTSLPGRRVRDIIDHPWLEGLIVRSATINSMGLNLRPEPVSLPLAPLLEELRATVAAGN